jgi:hypothetical protein
VAVLLSLDRVVPASAAPLSVIIEVDMEECRSKGYGVLMEDRDVIVECIIILVLLCSRGLRSLID